MMVDAASMGLVSNASSTHLSVFPANFQFLVIEVTKCSRKKLIKFMFGCLHSERVDSQEHAVETRKSH